MLKIKSIFVKYLIVFTALLVCGFLMLFLVFGSVLNEYSKQTKERIVIGAATQASDDLGEMYVENSDAAFPTFIENNKRAVMRLLSAIITNSDDISVTVTDMQGNVLLSTAQNTEGTPIPSPYTAEGLSLLQSITDNSSPVWLPVDVATQGKRFAYATAVKSNSDIAIGTVIVLADSVSWGDLSVAPIKSASVAALWVLLSAVIALYFITERIIDPLREMSRAAKRMACGKFDTRIRVRGHDEVAELAVAFNNMAESLQNLDRMRNTFIANVSHDLRTPMTTIAGFIDGILDGVIPESEQAHYLGVVSQEVRRLSRLVNQLLDISRLQAGDRKLTMKQFDICEMGRQILISFEQKIEAKQLDVSFDCDEDRMYVYADTDAIHQILYNICDNAVKFSREKGQLKMRFSRSEDTSSARKVIVSVYNEGCGIPPEDMPFIFERFYKSDKSRGMDKTGVGLGMYIAKTIMDAHGETISVKSEYGKDCEFTFTLTESATSARNTGGDSE